MEPLVDLKRISDSTRIVYQTKGNGFQIGKASNTAPARFNVVGSKGYSNRFLRERVTVQVRSNRYHPDKDEVILRIENSDGNPKNIVKLSAHNDWGTEEELTLTKKVAELEQQLEDEKLGPLSRTRTTEMLTAKREAISSFLHQLQSRNIGLDYDAINFVTAAFDQVINDL